MNNTSTEKLQLTGTPQSVIKAVNLTKSYSLGTETVDVLKSINFTVYRGEYVSIIGQSGAGKSTLLNIIGCLDTPSSGIFFLDDIDISKCSQEMLSDIRNFAIGFVFQNFNLLPKLTVFENVELPLIYQHIPKGKRNDMVREILERLHLWERRHHKPNEISGGQKQRVAIARAVIKKPSLILADEPTGNLDSNTTQEILNIFDELWREGNSIVMITHEPDVAQHAERTVRIVDGKITEIT